jgi:hypothetical protein
VNRKKTETYRFNGYPHSNPRSIHSVPVATLNSWITSYEAKLADPNDPDDKKWTARWLKRFTLERDKKLKGAVLKIQSKRGREYRWKDLT